MICGLASHPFRALVEESLIDSIFRGGLTKGLIQTLQDIYSHVPSLRSYIQFKLCKDVVGVLANSTVILDEEREIFRCINAAPAGSATEGVTSLSSSASSSQLQQALQPPLVQQQQSKNRSSMGQWTSPSKGLFQALKDSNPHFFGSIAASAKHQVDNVESSLDK